MPVRAPEIRANDNSASELDGDNYAITVHAVGIKLVIERRSRSRRFKTWRQGLP